MPPANFIAPLSIPSKPLRQPGSRSHAIGEAHPLDSPLHLISHFLRATSVGPLQVHVQLLKRGRAYPYLTARLIQNARIRTSYLPQVTIFVYAVFWYCRETPISSSTLSSPSCLRRYLHSFLNPIHSLLSHPPLSLDVSRIAIYLARRHC
jgi:Thioesterase-like superfamily